MKRTPGPYNAYTAPEGVTFEPIATPAQSAGDTQGWRVLFHGQHIGDLDFDGTDHYAWHVSGSLYAVRRSWAPLVAGLLAEYHRAQAEATP